MRVKGTALVGMALSVAVGATAVLAVRPSAASHAPDPVYLAPPGWSAPYTPAVRFGPFLYTSGQIGTRPGTDEFVPGGIEAETRQALENLRSVLDENGSSMDRVVKCLVMLADIDERPQMNEVYQTFFTDKKPARSAFATNGLYGGARVEIECIAAMK